MTVATPDHAVMLGAALRERRTEIGRQKGAVAGLAGTDPRTLHRMECGEEPVHDGWLPSLAYALDTTPALLIGRARRIHAALPEATS